MYRIGYIDEDDGQKNSFRQYLKNDFEIILFDITEDTEIDSLVDEIFDLGLDMLVLDFRLQDTGLIDFNADVLIDKIQERNLYYPLVVLTSHEIDALDHLEDANIVYGKDEMLGDKITIFKQILNKIADTYQSKISKAEVKLAELEKKRNEDGLKPNDEDAYVDLNIFLDKTMIAKGRISRTFYSEDTNKKLDDLIRKTETILEMIPNK